MRLNKQIFLEVESLVASSTTQLLHMKSFSLGISCWALPKNILFYYSVSCNEDYLGIWGHAERLWVIAVGLL